MAVPINTGSIQGEDEIVLRPVKIVHDNNEMETVYVQQDALGHADAAKIKSITNNLSIIYTVLGIIVLALSAYVYWDGIRNNKKIKLSNG